MERQRIPRRQVDARLVQPALPHLGRRWFRRSCCSHHVEISDDVEARNTARLASGHGASVGVLSIQRTRPSATVKSTTSLMFTDSSTA